MLNHVKTISLNLPHSDFSPSKDPRLLSVRPALGSLNHTSPSIRKDSYRAISPMFHIDSLYSWYIRYDSRVLEDNPALSKVSSEAVFNSFRSPDAMKARSELFDNIRDRAGDLLDLSGICRYMDIGVVVLAYVEFYMKVYRDVG